MILGLFLLEMSLHERRRKLEKEKHKALLKAALARQNLKKDVENNNGKEKEEEKDVEEKKDDKNVDKIIIEKDIEKNIIVEEKQNLTHDEKMKIYRIIMIKIFFACLLNFLIINTAGITQLLDDNLTIILGLPLGSIVLLTCLINELWLNGLIWHIDLVITITTCIICLCSLLLPYKIALIIILMFCLIILPLIWPLLLTKISFFTSAVTASTEEICLVMWILSSMDMTQPRDHLIVYASFILGSSLIWLLFHILLLYRRKEHHFISFNSNISNLVNISIKMILILSFDNRINISKHFDNFEGKSRVRV